MRIYELLWIQWMFIWDRMMMIYLVMEEKEMHYTNYLRDDHDGILYMIFE